MVHLASLPPLSPVGSWLAIGPGSPPDGSSDSATSPRRPGSPVYPWLSIHARASDTSTSRAPRGPGRVGSPRARYLPSVRRDTPRARQALEMGMTCAAMPIGYACPLSPLRRWCSHVFSCDLRRFVSRLATCREGRSRSTSSPDGVGRTRGLPAAGLVGVGPHALYGGRGATNARGSAFGSFAARSPRVRRACGLSRGWLTPGSPRAHPQPLPQGEHEADELLLRLCSQAVSARPALQQGQEGGHGLAVVHHGDQHVHGPAAAQL